MKRMCWMAGVMMMMGCGLLGCVTVSEAPAAALPRVTEGTFASTADGRAVRQFTLENSRGLKAVLIDFGATLVSLETPDRNGTLADIVLGCDDLGCYEGNGPYFGATVGRYANRIARGRFSLDGTEYTLATNNEPNHLHGGNVGFNKVIWEAESFTESEAVGVRFRYLSADMEEGYPGNLQCEVTYTLTQANELKIEYGAETDKPTLVNLTHHSYFNLAGHNSGDVLGHVMMINADHYTPTDNTLIPTGKIETVGATPLNFTQPASIGAQIGLLPAGYDHNFVLNKTGNELSLAARVREPASGRVMEIHTTEPGLQFYSGNFLGGVPGKGGAVYGKHHGFCLEAQHFPDSPNQPGFPSTVLRPGERYHQLTVHTFGVE